MPGSSVSSPGVESEMGIMAVRRSAWSERRWTILGITYTSVRTTFDYSTSSGRVTAGHLCYGTYVNYVPLRSIDKSSGYTLGNGLGTCETRWTLGRPFQATATGIQGLRVNGYGTIVSTWGP